jgi:glycosyltransferase involved in cell wall biosynthesis
MSKIQVFIPTYNRARLLEEALLSCQRQTFRDFECVVLDNCSSDITSSLVASLQSQYGNIRYLRRSVNIGMIENLNAIRDLVSSEFFCILTDDDTYYPSFLGTALELLLKFPSADIAVTSCLRNRSGKVLRSQTESWKDGSYAPTQALHYVLKGEHPIITNCLFRRQCSAEFVFDSDVEGGSDILLFIRLLACKGSAYSSTVTGLWNEHDRGHTSLQSGTRQLEILAHLKAKADYCLRSAGLARTYPSPTILSMLFMLFINSDINSVKNSKICLSSMYANNFCALLVIGLAATPAFYWPIRYLLQALRRTRSLIYDSFVWISPKY